MAYLFCLVEQPATCFDFPDTVVRNEILEIVVQYEPNRYRFA